MTMPSKSQLRWQCRRGMRELDQLLVRYLDEHYDTASAADKSAFAELLSLSDPELMGYLLLKAEPARHLANVINRILDRPEA